MNSKNKTVTGILFAVLLVALIWETILLLDYRTTVERVSLQLENERKTNQDDADKETIAKIKTINELIEQNYLYEIDEIAVEKGLLTGMLWGLGDVYSCYYTEEEMGEITQDATAEYSGIGAVLTTDATYGRVTVVKTYEGSPSQKAGILQGDYITEVNGEDVSELDLAAIVTRIKGEEGTPVTLTVYRADDDKFITFEMKRQRVEIPSVSGEMLSESIGYILIESWDMLTYSQFEKTMEELLAQGMQGVVIDVRNNPGGVVQAACDVLDYFVEDGGKLVYTVDKNGVEEDYMAADGFESVIPLVVMTNANSASSSEIFAGGIRDYKVGTLVGEKTFGKGIVQKIIDIGEGEAIKLTVAEYYLPNGESIHGEGIKPDFEIALSESLLKKSVITHEEDNQLQKAISVLKSKMTE